LSDTSFRFSWTILVCWSKYFSTCLIKNGYKVKMVFLNEECFFYGTSNAGLASFCTFTFGGIRGFKFILFLYFVVSLNYFVAKKWFIFVDETIPRFAWMVKTKTTVVAPLLTTFRGQRTFLQFGMNALKNYYWK
jgi:hypothetical protein